MIRKGLWSPDEDEKLRRSISKYVNGSWNDIARKAGLQRCGRSCRQRWLNHLRPGLRKEKFSKDEVKQVMELQSKLGNRWSEIAAQMTGRTDNEVKNLWNTVIKRRRLYTQSSPAQILHAPAADAEDLIDYSHADSPSHTASSQSASSSHSSWSLHVSPSHPAPDHHHHHVISFMDELSLLNPEQLIMINGPDDLLQGDQPPIINGHDCLHVDQHAAATSGSLGLMQVSYADFVNESSSNSSCLMHSSPAFNESTLPIVAHFITPPLSPDWDSAVKLVDVDANLISYTPINSLPFKSLPNYIIESGSHSHSTFSFTPTTTKTSQNHSILESSTLPSKTTKTFQSSECDALLSKLVETPPSNGNGHYLRSLILPPQCMSMNHEGSQALAPSPQLINIMNHEGRSYAFESSTNNDAYDDSSPASSFLQTSFNHHFECSTQDIIANLLWYGGCQ